MDWHENRNGLGSTLGIAWEQPSQEWPENEARNSLLEMAWEQPSQE